MTDTYATLTNSALGKKVASLLGLPRPTPLRRYAANAPLIDSPVLLCGHGDTPLLTVVRSVLTEAGVGFVEDLADAGADRLGAIVADLSAVASPEDLAVVRTGVGPALKRLGRSGRVIVLGRPVGDALDDPGRASARRALEGITRSIGKECRWGSTANLVHVATGADDAIASTLRFLLSGRSAYVSGQVVTVGDGPHITPDDWARPLAGKVAVVTGAARGIGASIADVLARDGAKVVGVDMPSSGDALAAVVNGIGGSALQLDITAVDAGERIVEHCQRLGGIDIVVHNAGITRDKLLVNMDENRWDSVLDVNLGSILRMNESLLGPGGVRDGGHLVLVSSIAGIAGNRGQTNYAASKAGVIGLVASLSADPGLRGRGITVNAVAPGFIETEMTARMPFATREVGRRANSLSQGGLPIDVAETIGWFAEDASGGVNGNVVRVCGQSLLGA